MIQKVFVRQRRLLLASILVGIALVLSGCDSPTAANGAVDGVPSQITMNLSAAEVNPPDDGATTAFSITLYEETLAGGDPDPTGNVLELSLNHSGNQSEVPAGEYDIDATNPTGEWYLLGYPGQQLQYLHGDSYVQLVGLEGSLTVHDGSTISWNGATADLNLEGEFTMEPFPGGGAATTVAFQFDGTATIDPD